MNRLILLKKKNPIIFEIYRYDSNNPKNLLLSTKDGEFARNLVDGYNTHMDNFSILSANKQFTYEEAFRIFMAGEERGEYDMFRMNNPREAWLYDRVPLKFRQFIKSIKVK